MPPAPGAFKPEPGFVRTPWQAARAFVPKPRRAPYIAAMEAIIPVLVVLAMLGALGALMFGVFTMARGNDPRRSNKIMQYRVLFQGVALALFALFMMLYHHR